MSTTLVAPIDTQQINSDLYVGEGYLNTIQNAVDYATAQGGSFEVIIPTGYAGSDTIPSVLRGNANITIADRRGAQIQHYNWDGSAYIPTVMTLLGGLNIFGPPPGWAPATTSQITAGVEGGELPQISMVNASAPADSKAYDNALDGNGSMHFRLINDAGNTTVDWLTVERTGMTAAVNIPGYLTVGAEGGLSITGPPPGWAPATTSQITAGVEGGELPQISMVNASAPADSKAYDNALDGTGSMHFRLINDAGNTTVDWLTVDRTGMTAAVNIGGNFTVAGDASLATCEVDSSPVRTFANTPDAGGGATFPPAGVGVSTGTAWSTSIDPATIAMLNQNANFQDSVTVGGSLTAKGITMSPTGTNVNSTINFGQNYDQPAIILFDLAGNQYGWGLNPGEMQFYIGPQSPGHFSWNNGGAFSPSGVNEIARLDPTTGFTVKGALIATGLQVSSPVSGAGTTIASFMEPNATSGVVGLQFGKTSAANGCASVGYDVVNNSMDFAIAGAAAQIMTLDASGNLIVPGLVKTQQLDGIADIQINASDASHGVYLNWGNNGNGVSFGNGAGGQVGGMTAAGAFTAVTKNFRIVHPLNKKKYLTHSCIEGPEIAVFYRGEGRTNKSGRATVKLPDYFEALTHESGRTVQLTALIEDEDGEEFGQLAASRVEDGTFGVRSSLPLQQFYWEVKAVRADIAPLEVVTARTAADDGPTAERMRQATKDFVPAKKAGKR